MATASWPIMASTTNRISSGSDRVPDVGGLAHQLLVDAQPAGGVDDDHVVLAAARLVDRVAGPPRPGRRRRCPARGRTPERRPARRPPAAAARRWGAAGRPRPASGVLPCSLSHSASLPASVVLPEPCRPASMITVGGALANRSRRASPPRIWTSSSLTILMTCCAGFSAADTSSRRARSLTRAMNCAHHGQRDVRLEQRDADLAGGRVDVGGGQPPVPAQIGEDLSQPVGESLEHAPQAIRSGPPGQCCWIVRPAHRLPNGEENVS